MSDKILSIFPILHAPMESKYVTGSILAVILAAVVLGTAVGGLTAGSHFIAGVGPKEPATFGGNRISPSMLPAQGTLIVSASWGSGDTGACCAPSWRRAAP